MITVRCREGDLPSRRWSAAWQCGWSQQQRYMREIYARYTRVCGMQEPTAKPLSSHMLAVKRALHKTTAQFRAAGLALHLCRESHADQGRQMKRLGICYTVGIALSFLCFVIGYFVIADGGAGAALVTAGLGSLCPLVASAVAIAVALFSRTGRPQEKWWITFSRCQVHRSRS